METMQPALKNGRNVWDAINMPKEEFEARVERVRTKMAARGLDLLLVHTVGFTEYGDTAYLTNYIPRVSRGTIVAVPLKGEVVTFLGGPSRGLLTLKVTCSFGDMVAVGDMSKECAKLLRGRKLIPGTIGLAGVRRYMPYQQYRTLMTELDGCTLQDADDIIAGFRTVKSSRETDQIKRAARIISRLTIFLKETSFENISERVIEAALYRQARLEGAEDFRMLIADPGQSACFFRPSDDAPVAAGEKVIVYLTVAFERYWAEVMRTFTFRGKSFVEERGEETRLALQKLCTMIRPGVSISGFARDASSLMDRKGLDFLRPYGLGSGIGLESQEAPLLASESEMELKEGMVLTVRLATEGCGDRPFVIGETLLVGGDRGHILTEDGGTV